MKEPYDTTFRKVGDLMVNTLQGTANNDGARADYGSYCRNHKDEVVRFLGACVSRRTNGVRSVRALPVPSKYSDAALYLQVYTEGVPSDTVHYIIRCPAGAVNSIEVTLAD